MYKLCKTEQSAARQRQLELVLLDAMGSHSYEKITVSDLCEWMGVPRKSFYRYFSGKEGALQALIDHTMAEYGGGSGYWLPMNRDTVHKELEGLFEFWKRQKPLLDALKRNGLSGILIERGVGHALELVGLNQRSTRGPLVTLQEHSTAFIACGLMVMVVQWHHGGYVMTPQQMAAIAEKIVTQPLIGG